jgi:hypothetical protein
MRSSFRSDELDLNDAALQGQHGGVVAEVLCRNNSVRVGESTRGVDNNLPFALTEMPAG